MFGRKYLKNKSIFMEEHTSFKTDYIYKILSQKEFDNNYLNDEEFIKDLIEFGYKAAIKIKITKEHLK